ncbi:hypothetical protein, partial [Agrobacterium tumefaciens]|uniref:hypothetical protein n=2 Tax=Agrobacterium TaxID=357 RepID=UPI000B2EF406
FFNRNDLQHRTAARFQASFQRFEIARPIGLADLSCLPRSFPWCSFFPFGSFPESQYYSDADLVVLNAAATRAMALKMEVVTTLPEELFLLQTMGARDGAWLDV